MKQNLFAVTFSKDRAPQLELLLESIKDHFEPGAISEHFVTMKASDEVNVKAYQKLQGLPVGKSVKWLVEGDFRSNLEKVVEYFYRKDPDGYLIWFTDDDVVYRPTGPVQGLLEKFDKTKHLCLSLRHDAAYDHKWVVEAAGFVPGTKIVPDWTTTGEGFVEWDWTKAEHSPWNYPFSVEGHIYSLKLIRDIVQRGIYKAPNTFESFGTSALRELALRPTFGLRHCLAAKKGSLFGNAINKTQTEWETPHGKTLTIDFLNQKYLEGFVFDKEQFYHKIKVTDMHCIFEDSSLLVPRK